MFYLRHFFQVLRHIKFSGLFFVTLTIVLTTSLHHRHYLKKVFSMSKKVVSRPYFNALITDKINLTSLSRKMNQLPGVEKVTIKKTMDVGKELGSLSTELGSDFVKGLADLNYASLTIELSNNLQSRSQSLIKEYLARLVGKNSVAISDVKTPKKITLSKNDPYQVINDWGDLYILAIITVLWIMSCWSLVTYLKNYAYLIEKFQRKKNVALKIYMGGFVSITVLTIMINIYLRPTIAWDAWLFLTFLGVTSWPLITRKKYEFRKFV